MVKTRRESMVAREERQDQEDDISDEESGQKQTKMTYQQEDIFIALIIDFYNIVEKKSTDKSLTPKKLKDAQDKAWNDLRDAFINKTNVSK